MMKIDNLVVGPIETNCYILSDTESKEAVIIDAVMMQIRFCVILKTMD